MKYKLTSLLSIFTLAISLGFVTVSCNSANSGQEGVAETAEATSGKKPVFTLTEEGTYDFGKVKDGDVVEKSFAFKNTGEAPLVISNISASCGCTTPEWPKDPIAPGGESNIVVKFNTTGKPGQQNKTVTITANTEPSVIELHVKGVVEGK
jgi:hypothetical protein